jgi:predicted transcriptional regulator
MSKSNKSLLELTVELSAVHTSASATLSVEELVDVTRTIFKTLKELYKNDPTNNPSPDSTQEAANTLAYLRQHPRNSIEQSQIVCLECGLSFKLLSNRHLGPHHLTPRDYKRKWGIPLTTPLSSRTLTERRRKQAKEMGMGAQLAAWRAAKRNNNGVVVVNSD